MRANAFAAHLLMPEPGGRTAIEGTADDAERAVRVADAGLAPDEDAFGTAGPDALGEILEEMAPGR